MIGLLQRVRHAKVEVDNQTIGEIEQGLLVLVGVEPNDGQSQIEKLAHKLLHYRVFQDEHDKMNLNVQSIHGSILLVPQFTLAATTTKGLRPGFSSAATPEVGLARFHQLVEEIKRSYPHVATGEFGANMQVTLCNDGPVTFWLQV